MLLIPTLLCPQAWESMSGNEATRFCSYCKKHVHNLEAMSVRERLALLSSPAASICSRYKVAIRHPALGRKESYMRHMLKYGANVALTSSALLVLCEMYADDEKRSYYRAFAGRTSAAPHPPLDRCGFPGVEPSGAEWPGFERPDAFYVEQEVEMVGMLALPDSPKATLMRPGEPVTAPDHIDLDLDPTEIGKLLQPATPPPIEFKTSPPKKVKKVRKFPGLRGWGA